MAVIKEKPEGRYSEGYTVIYEYEEDGFFKEGEKEYFTFSKGRHGLIQKHFQKQYPNFRVKKIIYH